MICIVIFGINTTCKVSFFNYQILIPSGSSFRIYMEICQENLIQDKII